MLPMARKSNNSDIRIIDRMGRDETIFFSVNVFSRNPVLLDDYYRMNRTSDHRFHSSVVFL